MANWSLPTLSDLYTNFRAYLTARLDDVAKMFDSALVSATNLPTGTKRWNSTASKWEKWDGSAWSPMATTYGISISGNAATASQASGLTPGVALGNIGVNGLSYAYMQDISATQRVLGRNSAGAGDPQEISLSQLLDWAGTCAQGDILYRGATGWARLAAGTKGSFLKTQGAGANPIWAEIAVSVKDFGAVGDGVTDDTAAFQAWIAHLETGARFQSFPAFTSGVARSGYIPEGEYQINGELRISVGGVSVFGAGPSASRIVQYNATATTFNVSAVSPDSNRIDHFAMAGVGIYAGAPKTSGNGIRVVRGQWVSLRDIHVEGHFHNVAIIGGTKIRIDGLVSEGGYTSTNLTNGSCLFFDAHVFANTTIEVPANVVVSNFTLRGFAPYTQMQQCLLVRALDAARFTGGYIGSAGALNVFMSPSSTTKKITAVGFSTCYFDTGGTIEETEKGVLIGGTQARAVDQIGFSNCDFHGHVRSVEIAEAAPGSIRFYGCRFYNFTLRAVSIYAENASVTLSACNFRLWSTPQANPLGVICFKADSFTVTGCDTHNTADPTYVFIKTFGTIARVAITGNTPVVNGTNVDIQGIITRLSCDFEQTYTPVLSFGGVNAATNGATFSVISGSYRLLGDRTEVNIRIVVTNKGSGSGDIIISPPPFGAASTSPVLQQVCPVVLSGVVEGTTDKPVFALAGGTGLLLYKGNGTGATALTAADLTNNSIIMVSASYRNN